MFSASTPTSPEGFFNRARELARLEDAVDKLQRGAPKWLCLVGPRKVGKTSLLREAERRTRARARAPGFVVVDVFETLPVSLEVFRHLAVQAIEVLLSRDAGRSLAAEFDVPAAWRAALVQSNRFRGLPSALQTTLGELPTTPLEGPGLTAVLNLPERLAEALGAHLVVALDEFQELAALSGVRGGPDVMSLLRSVWQRHRRTTYVVSGSARSTLLELATSQGSPFFQHFEVMEVEAFDETHAVELLVHASRDTSQRIDEALARRIFKVVGGSPFYLQIIGEAVTEEQGTVDARLRGALQRALFSETGRLSLYFLNEFQRLVGRATTLAATLNALAPGPRTLTGVAKSIGGASAAAAGYLQRLGDAVMRNAEGQWQLTDATFALWLQWRQPGGTVLPMKLVGDEAELAVAQALAHLGFELVYQSRGSRGAFDLLATRGARILAVQVKRSPLPLRFTKAAWGRMEADAERYGWQWLIAQVSPDGVVQLLDPSKATRRAGVSLSEATVMERPLDWLERRQSATRAKKTRR
ncbi:MAG: ATP-binding protein [Archangium sp.]|nr:ATP-binding protein [Archangium sp.]MDP3153202.1 ATP-binding protein [Archangium sp.]MDP3570236.1 ATP-binding protein [Archangium sp.]